MVIIKISYTKNGLAHPAYFDDDMWNKYYYYKEIGETSLTHLVTNIIKNVEW